MPARVCQISACSVSVRPPEMDTMDTTSLRGNCVQPAGNEERGEGRRRRGGENGKVSQRESALLPLSLVLRRVSERGRPLCLSFPERSSPNQAPGGIAEKPVPPTQGAVSRHAFTKNNGSGGGTASIRHTPRTHTLCDARLKNVGHQKSLKPFL